MGMFGTAYNRILDENNRESHPNGLDYFLLFGNLAIKTIQVLTSIGVLSTARFSPNYPSAPPHPAIDAQFLLPAVLPSASLRCGGGPLRWVGGDPTLLSVRGAPVYFIDSPRSLGRRHPRRRRRSSWLLSAPCLLPASTQSEDGAPPCIVMNTKRMVI
jgi:hypothetical protein